MDIFGGIAGRCNEGKVYECGNEATINANDNVGGIIGFAYSKSEISLCFNKGNINATGDCSAGGIIRYNQYANVYNCYNTANIYALIRNVGGINGAAGRAGQPTAYTYNCYNIGIISGQSYKGQITGWANALDGSSRDVNCYTTNATAELLNSGEYSENTWVNDVKNEDGTWKYNNGYPILKWQIINNTNMLKNIK